MQESFAAFNGNFFQRFQTVGGEAGADNVDALGAVFTQRFKGLIGVGLQPFGFAKARLESDDVVVFFQPQRLGNQAAGFVCFAMVRITLGEMKFGHAVEGHQ